MWLWAAHYAYNHNLHVASEPSSYICSANCGDLRSASSVRTVLQTNKLVKICNNQRERSTAYLDLVVLATECRLALSIAVDRHIPPVATKSDKNNRQTLKTGSGQLQVMI
jgi:hypothetical protein